MCKARFKAERTVTGRLRILARSTLVNTDHLAMEWGRQPTRAEVAREYGLRARLAAREVWKAAAKRAPGRPDSRSGADGRESRNGEAS